MKSVAGKIYNEDEMVASLRKRGFYSSGVPRPSERTTAMPKPRRLSKKDLRSMTESEFRQYVQQYINDQGEG